MLMLSVEALVENPELEFPLITSYEHVKRGNHVETFLKISIRMG